MREKKRVRLLNRIITVILAICMIINMAVPSVYAAESGKIGRGIFGFSGEKKTEDEAAGNGSAAGEAGVSADGQESVQGTVDGDHYFVGELTEAVNDAVITVTVPEQAKLPEDTKLTVREIKENASEKAEREEYEGYLEQAKAVVEDGSSRTVTGGRFFDISFETEAAGFIEVSEDGKIEPSAPIDVKIEYQNAVEVSSAAEVQAVHLPDDAENSLIETDAVTADSRTDEESVEVSEVSFTADSFSVYGVVYTVDFQYGEYAFSIEGESEIMLSEMLSKLGITDVKIEDVKNVTFSDESLVTVEKVDGDWKLLSLKPFTSEEKLTIELADRVIEIRVTDAQTATVPVVFRNEFSGEFEVDFPSGRIADLIGNYTNGSAAYYRSFVYTNDAQDKRIYWVWNEKGIIKYSDSNVNSPASNHIFNLADNQKIVIQLHNNYTYNSETGKFYIMPAATTITPGKFTYTEQSVKELASGSVEQPKVITAPDNKQELDEQNLTGKNNETSDDLIWKNSELIEGEDGESVRITLNYFRKRYGSKIDFIYVMDETGTMESNISVTFGSGSNQTAYTAPRYFWSRIIATRASQFILSWNGDETGFDNRVYFVPWGGSTYWKSGFMSKYSDVLDWFNAHKSAATGDATHHNTTYTQLEEVVNESANAGRMPVVIYLSDYYLHAANLTAASRQKLNKADVYPVLIYPADTKSVDRMSNFNDDTDYQYTMGNDPNNLLGIFADIITKEISFIDPNTVVTDQLSSALKSNSANGAGDIVWQQNNGKNEDGTYKKIENGVVYTKTVTVPLKNQVYSGAMPTNGDMTVKNGNKTLNSISATQSPVLEKDLTILVKENDTSGTAIKGAEFALYKGDLNDTLLTFANPIWTGTSDDAGKLTIEYGTGENQCTFPAGTTYTLKEVGAADGYALPAFTWKLEVGNDYVIRPSNVTQDGYNDGKVRSLGMRSVAGNLEVYNENYVYFEIINNTTYEYDVWNIGSVDGKDLLYNPGAYVVHEDGTWGSLSAEEHNIASESTLKLAVITGANQSFNLDGGFINPDQRAEIYASITNQNEEVVEKIISKNPYNTKDFIVGTHADRGKTVTVIFDGGRYVCKITDESRNLLYLDAAHTKPAIYSTLIKGFAGTNGKLYRADGTEYPNDNSHAVNLELLRNVDQVLQIGVTVMNRPVTLTTAEKDASDGYPYLESGDKATITRKGTYQSLLYLFYANLTLKDIVLDGNKDKYTGGLGSLIYTYADHYVVVTLEDGAVLQNAKACGHGGAVDVELNGTLNMKEGALITDCESSDFGGAVHIHEKNSVFNMEGGTIDNCSAVYGGAIGTQYARCVNTTGEINISGGTIQNCSATYGGAIYLRDNHVLNLSGGTIEKNSASMNGGAVYLNLGCAVTGTHFNMTGGTISKNTAKSASAVYVGNYNVFAMSGGSITGNTSDSSESVGAIEVGGVNNRLEFSGSPVIYNNTDSAKKQANVLLNQASDKIIQVTGNMGSDAKIGVWPTKTNYQNEGERFAATVAEGANYNLTGFLNDYASDHANSKKYLYGWPETNGAAGNVIWKAGLRVEAYEYSGSRSDATLISAGVVPPKDDFEYSNTAAGLAAEYAKSDSVLPSAINEKGLSFVNAFYTPTTVACGSDNNTVSNVKFDGSWKLEVSGTYQSYKPENVVRLYYSQNVKLTVSETTTGAMGDVTKDFSFTISGFEAGKKCTYTKYEKMDGTSYTEMTGADASGELTAGANGTIKFTLKHNQKIEISVPYNSSISISEENGHYKTTWSLDNDKAVAGTGISTTVAADTTIDVVNTLDDVAPTGVSTTFLPYLCILIAGIAGAVIYFRRRRTVE